MRLDLGEARALHHRGEPPADGLDFGQFRHCASFLPADIAPPAWPRYGPARKGLFAMARAGETTHFGFDRVSLGDKQGLVDDVFRNVAQPLLVAKRHPVEAEMSGFTGA